MKGDFPLDRAAAPRWMTVPVSYLYRWSSARYHKSWDKREPFRAAAPVISVGNLTVGGTGKSPTVLALAELLKEWYPELRAEHAIAVLSRGYGRHGKGIMEVAPDTPWEKSGDEPLMIKRALPELAVVVHEERSKGAEYAVEKLGSKLLLLDDGFQHRAIHRDLNLVLLDGSHPFGNQRMLPAGPLREQPEALNRADVILAVGEEVDAAQFIALQYEKPFIQLKQEFTLPDAISSDSSKRVFIVSGIARPQRLFNILDSMNLNSCGVLAFSDHHPFTGDDLEAIHKTAQRADADVILTTTKDRVRMDSWSYDLPVVVPKFRVRFADPEAVRSLIDPILAKV